MGPLQAEWTVLWDEQERTCVCRVLGKYRGVVLGGREAGRAPLWVTGKRVSGLDGWADGLESAVRSPACLTTRMSSGNLRKAKTRVGAEHLVRHHIGSRRWHNVQ